jgi:glycerophosphoryl diester phosphodiesterase
MTPRRALLLPLLAAVGFGTAPSGGGGRCLAIAHRGFSAAAPENTMAAFRLCLERGFPAVECDVRLSADGVPVLLHDETLQRTAGVPGKVGERTLAELRALDVGAWKDPRFAGERIPTFEALLKFVGGRMTVFIDMKEPIEDKVVAAVRSSGVPWESVVLCTHRAESLERAARAEPRLPRAWYVRNPPADAEGLERLLREGARLGAAYLGCAARELPPGLVPRAHAKGLKVLVWTVNDPGEMRRLSSSGVDGIFTDVPDVLLGALRP